MTHPSFSLGPPSPPESHSLGPHEALAFILGDFLHPPHALPPAHFQVPAIHSRPVVTSLMMATDHACLSPAHTESLSGEARLTAPHRDPFPLLATSCRTEPRTGRLPYSDALPSVCPSPLLCTGIRCSASHCHLFSYADTSLWIILPTSFFKSEKLFLSVRRLS